MRANQALVDREGSSYYYLPLTPRVSLPSPSQSAVQVSMSMAGYVACCFRTFLPTWMNLSNVTEDYQFIKRNLCNCEEHNE